MTRPTYYDRDGRPISLTQYAGLIEDRTYARVELTRIGDREISTVWLGIDHAFGGGRPLIFETMIFVLDRDGKRQQSTSDQWRYSTEAEARAGHAERVAELAGGLN